MMPGPAKIIACPYCDHLAQRYTLSSGNTLDGVQWTDGKVKYPMFPSYPRITRCTECRGYYWLEDAEEIGELRYWDKEHKIPEEWEKAETVQPLTWQENIDAFLHDMGDELFFRMASWWKFNDAYRDDTEAAEPYELPEEMQQNMHRLYQLLGNDIRDKILKAEIKREMGDFDGSIRLLKEISETGTPEEEHIDIITFITGLAQKQDKSVRKII